MTQDFATTSEVEQLRRELAEMKRQSRRRRVAVLTGLVGLAVIWGASALGAVEVGCAQALPLSLFCFRSDEPAYAGQVNGNFKALADEIAAAEVRQQNLLSGQLATTTARIAALELQVNGDGGVIAGTTQRTGLLGRERVLSGSLIGGNVSSPGICGQAFNGACSVTFPAGYFSTTPRCVAMARTPDTTGYSENVVMTAVSATGISFWEGQYVAGANLVFDWICVGS